MPNSRKRRSRRNDGWTRSGDAAKRLYEMYEAGPAGAGVPAGDSSISWSSWKREQAELEEEAGWLN